METRLWAELRQLQKALRSLFQDFAVLRARVGQSRQDIGQLGSWGNGGGGGGGLSPAVATSIITGEALDTAGTGTAILRITAGTSMSDGEEVDVLNNFTDDTPMGAKVMLGQDELGRWWLLSEDCAE